MTKKWRNVEKTAGEVLPLLKPGRVICVFDTETTGLPRKGKAVKIIQFSAIRLEVLPGYRFREIDFLDLYMNPEEKLDQKITEITGITDEVLAYAATEEEVAPAVFEYLQKADVWAAYNAPFDLKMIEGMSERTGIYFEKQPTVDVLEFSRDWLMSGVDVENHKLGTTYKYLYPDGVIQFHRAIEDVEATIKVMEALLPRYASIVEENAQPKKEVVIEKAYAWINPHNPRQQRICLTLTDGDAVSSGDIFYDVVDKCWSHKATTKAKKLFASLDLYDIEARVLQLCSNYYQTFDSMDELAKSRISWLQKKKREEKAKA